MIFAWDERLKFHVGSFAPAEEIGQYFKSVATKYDLYDSIKMNTEVTRAEWDEKAGMWTIDAVDRATGERSRVTGDIFVNAGGILNAWKWPDIDGLKTFDGPCLHTAAWVGLFPLLSGLPFTMNLAYPEVGLFGRSARQKNRGDWLRCDGRPGCAPAAKGRRFCDGFCPESQLYPTQCRVWDRSLLLQ
jgi:hypothetical protein